MKKLAKWFAVQSKDGYVSAVTQQPHSVTADLMRQQMGGGDIEVVLISEQRADSIMQALLECDVKIDSKGNIVEQRKRDVGVSYREHRSAAYPAIGDQLDAIWKAIAGGDMTEAEKMMEKIQSVKLAHPKPQ